MRDDPVMRSPTRPYGLCLVRIESQPLGMLMTVITDYGTPHSSCRTHFFDDVDAATAAVRTYLLSFLRPGTAD